jgi:hypothetical protein
VDDEGLYRVVGVRADGVRVVVDEGITAERAQHFRMLLIDANAFPDARVEADEPPVQPEASVLVGKASVAS